MNTNPIVVEQQYSTPAAAVWKAITDKEQMRRWFFEPMTEFEPVVGFETEFDVECEGQIYPHQWKVTEVVPQVKITYDWRYRGYAGQSSVTWELSEISQGTKLKLTHNGQETFQCDDPVLGRESCEAGWKYFLQDSLKAFLEQQVS